MTNENYTVRVLRADDGHMLTQAVRPDDIQAVVISPVVFLAATDDPANWREITADEADVIRSLQRQAAIDATEADKNNE